MISPYHKQRLEMYLVVTLILFALLLDIWKLLAHESVEYFLIHLLALLDKSDHLLCNIPQVITWSI